MPLKYLLGWPYNFRFEKKKENILNCFFVEFLANEKRMRSERSANHERYLSDKYANHTQTTNEQQAIYK